jgi:hypothetical protein
LIRATNVLKCYIDQKHFKYITSLNHCWIKPVENYPGKYHLSKLTYQVEQWFMIRLSQNKLILETLCELCRFTCTRETLNYFARDEFSFDTKTKNFLFFQFIKKLHDYSGQFNIHIKNCPV